MSSEAIYTCNNGVALKCIDVMINDKSMSGHKYVLSGLQGLPAMEMRFQAGPIPLNGPNGWTNEHALAAIIHRTEYLNSLFPCVQNRMAIQKMKEALELFEARTKERTNRGVEGKNIV